MTPGILFFLVYYAQAKNQNWVFMGTQFSVNTGNGFIPRNLTDTTIVENYIKRTTPDLWRSIANNFGRTQIKRNQPRDKAYYNDKLLDHACPMTVRSGVGSLRHRFPDVIGIGFAKCGTGAMAFLDCHPGITFRTTEPRFFSKEEMLDQILKAAKEKNHAK